MFIFSFFLEQHENGTCYTVQKIETIVFTVGMLVYIYQISTLATRWHVSHTDGHPDCSCVKVMLSSACERVAACGFAKPPL